MRRLTAGLSSALLLALLAAPVGAEALDGNQVTTHQDDTGATTVSVNRDGSVTQPRSRGGSGISCNYFDTFNTETEAIQFVPSAGDFQDGLFYWVECFSAGGDPLLARYFQYQQGQPPISPYRLALAASSTLDMPFPEPRTNPERGVDQLVGIDTWLWIDPAAWQPLSTTVSIPGLSATVTATPVSATWDMGDAQDPVVCDGPGTPYDVGRPEAGQSTDCSHLYQVRGAYTATVTILYEVSWSASNGEAGTLEPAPRSTQFPMSVAERQAIGA